MSENTKTKDQKPKAKLVWIVFALLIVGVYFTGLTIPLLGPDEPRYAEVAREMFTRGDWITPTLGGFDWFEKPALLYWLQIVSYKLFGVSEFAARFGSALFGLGTVFSLWILGQKSSAISNQQSGEIQNRSNFANWLALIAASSLGLIVFSHGASFDIILTFPITSSLVAFFLFDQSREKSGFTFYFLLITFYFFIGVSLIAKGLVGIVFPLAIVAFYYLLSRKFPSKQFIYSLFWGTCVALLVACVWYLPMYRANGWKFIDEFFIQHHFQRYFSNKYQHPQPFYFFFWVLPLMTLPWLPFFLASIWNLLKVPSSKFKVQEKEKISTLYSPLTTFAVAWLLVPLVFFSVSGSKLPGYILPALPAAMILTADYIYRFVQKSAKRELAIKIVAFATFAAVLVVFQFFLTNYTNPETTKNLIESANSQGYSKEKIVNLFTVSHNLEFYAPDRIVRDMDGNQKRYDDFYVLVTDLKNEKSGEILVALPSKNVLEISESKLVDSTLLGNNGETSLILIKIK
ncbi:hypothetical protein BH10ACI1_BH10ACI1_13710 [soil metagenome]